VRSPVADSRPPQAPGERWICTKLPPFEAVVWRVSWSLRSAPLAFSAPLFCTRPSAPPSTTRSAATCPVCNAVFVKACMLHGSEALIQPRANAVLLLASCVWHTTHIHRHTIRHGCSPLSPCCSSASFLASCPPQLLPPRHLPARPHCAWEDRFDLLPLTLSLSLFTCSLSLSLYPRQWQRAGCFVRGWQGVAVEGGPRRQLAAARGDP
jgi:hypothetical protein